LIILSFLNTAFVKPNRIKHPKNPGTICLKTKTISSFECQETNKYGNTIGPAIKAARISLAAKSLKFVRKDSGQIIPKTFL
jgi:hypothetical protein